ncbi:hypothetical protein ACFL2Q_17850, partial [Thermodesulfobacteriota bacterium]
MAGLMDILRSLWADRSPCPEESPSETLSRLKSMGRDGNLRDIPPIFNLVFHRDDKISAQAAETVRLLLDNIPDSDWSGLYPRFRYLHLNSSRVRLLAEFEDVTAVHLLGIATLNGNGRIREKALRLLGDLEHPLVLPYLLLRQLDWVDRIRIRAHKLLELRLKAEKVSVSEVAKHYRLVEKLDRVSRIDLSSIIKVVFDWLRSPEHRA